MSMEIQKKKREWERVICMLNECNLDIMDEIEMEIYNYMIYME